MYYVFHHMEEYFRDQEKLLLASQKNIVLGKDWANCDPKELREEFYRIQRNLPTIIFKDVFLAEGEFHASLPATKTEEDTRNVPTG